MTRQQVTIFKELTIGNMTTLKKTEVKTMI